MLSCITPSSFRATLESADITSSFHPAPGTRETVTLTVLPGRNVLKLSVDGMSGTHAATDRDQLVFFVQ